MSLKSWKEINNGDWIEMDGLQGKIISVTKLNTTVPTKLGAVVAATVEWTRGRWKGNITEHILRYGSDTVNVVKKKRGGKGYFSNLAGAFMGR